MSQVSVVRRAVSVAFCWGKHLAWFSKITQWNNKYSFMCALMLKSSLISYSYNYARQRRIILEMNAIKKCRAHKNNLRWQITCSLNHPRCSYLVCSETILSKNQDGLMMRFRCSCFITLVFRALNYSVFENKRHDVCDCLLQWFSWLLFDTLLFLSRFHPCLPRVQPRGVRKEWSKTWKRRRRKSKYSASILLINML